jgi:hypothetical protein
VCVCVCVCICVCAPEDEAAGGQHAAEDLQELRRRVVRERNRYLPLLNRYLPLLNRYLPLLNRYLPLLNRYPRIGTLPIDVRQGPLREFDLQSNTVHLTCSQIQCI